MKRKEPVKSYPLSAMERAMYLEQKLYPESSSYNLNLGYVIQGAEQETIREAVRGLFLAHDALHASYGESDGVPMRRLLPEAPDVAIGSRLHRAEFEALLDDPGEPFMLEDGVPVRLTLYPLYEGGYGLHMQLHHIGFDRGSQEAFTGELLRRLKGEPIEAGADLKDAYTRSREKQEAASLAVFEEMFAGGVPVNEMPVKGPRPKELPVTDTVLLSEISAQEVGAFKETAGRFGLTLFELLLSVSAAVLGQYCASEDVVIGVPMSTRDDFSSGIIGMFVNTLPLRLRPRRGETLDSYFAGCARTIRDVKRENILPFAELVSRFCPERDAARNPFFDMEVNYLHAVEPVGDKMLSVELVESLQRMRRDIGLNISQRRTSMLVRLQYSTELYDPDVMENFLAQILQGLRLTASGDAANVRDILTLPEEQAAQLERFSQTAKADIPVRLLHRMFEEKAAAHPDRAAVIACDGTRTYGELNAEANRIAHGLMKRGLGKGEGVMLLLPRRSFYFSAVFGVLKTGAAFIPCDPAYPPERIRYILEDSGASCLLTTAERLADYSGLHALDINELLSEEDIGNPDTDMDGDELAYMIYTSGSTGKPKGVMLRHEGICNFCTIHPANIFYELISAHVERMLSVTTVSFDLSFKDTLGILCVGKSVVFASENEMNDPRELCELIQTHKADAMNATPSRYLQYLEYGPFREALSGCRLVAAGGENFPAALLEKLRALGIPHIVNTYGPTEATISSNMAYLTQADQVSVGKPLLNVEEYILDGDGALAPRGVTGELVIAGPGVAIGYRHLKQQTAERFVTWRGKRVFKTGDYARWDSEGNVLILGRMDGQVKLRGLRIELGEIEAVMVRQAGVRQAVASIRNIGGQVQLCAWYTADEEIDGNRLRAQLKQSLAEYMVPAAMARVDAIPVTANGKVNLKALPTPEMHKDEAAPPENETQQRIFEIVSEVLGHRDFGIRTGLFSIGLTSLNSVSLSLKLSEAFGTSVQIRDFRSHDTIEALETLLGERKEEEAFPLQDNYPITKIQEGVFFETQTHPGTTIYNLPTLIALDAGIDGERLREAVAAVVQAHPYLKARFYIDEKGDIRERRMDNEPFTAADIPVRLCGRIEEIQDTLARPFDLTKDRLFRAELIETDGRVYFFFDVHHILCDGISKNILLRDISAAYTGEKLSAEQYSGYEAALLEKRMRESGHYARAKAYYTGLFDGCEPDCLPIPDAIDTAAVGSGTIYAQSEKIVLEAVQAFCRKAGVSANAFFTAAFGYTLARYCGREDAIFVTVNNGRNDPRFANSVSMFVKTYPVLCRASGRTVREYLEDVSQQLLDSLTYDVYSFEEMRHELNIPADVMFVYQGGISEKQKTFCALPAESVPLRLNEAKAGLEFMVYPSDQGATVYCSYRKSLYTEGFVRRFLRVYEQVVSELMGKSTLKEIELADQETLELLDRFNETHKDWPVEDIVTRFRRQAAATPDNTAVVFKDRAWTYRQADDISDRIAAYLCRIGVGNDDAVSVLIPRCEYIALASLGVLKAGAAYQPLDPGYPPERLDFMVSDAGAKAVIADPALLDRIPNYTGPVLSLDDIASLPAAEELPEGPKPETAFILLYTSGSTGVPKGVVLEHRSLSNLCDWYRNYYALEETSRSANYASYGFDCCMLDLYPSLTTGATVYIIPEEIRLDLAAIARYIEENGISHMFMTTQVGRQFSQYYTGSSLKHLVVAGETLTPIDPSGMPFAVCNGYGPTECTILTTAFFVDRYYPRVPIGRPLDNYYLYVVDEQGRRLPPGVPGELWIAGRGVARGYVNRPEKNAESFLVNPFAIGSDERRVYRSGDTVRWLESGDIDFIGRGDGQVKIRGFRVELSEVETAILAFPGVTDATVQALDAAAGGKYLAAWVVGDKPLDLDAIGKFIAETKPAYMVPEAMMQIERIPLNQNQKVNKRALPAIVPAGEREDDTAENRPMTQLETDIAAVVRKILGEARISPAVNLARYGLTSISAIGLVTALSEHFKTEIPVLELLGGWSIMDIADFLYKTWKKQGFGSLRSGTEAASSGEGQKKSAFYPLTSVQMAVYYDQMKREGADTIYNIPFCCVFENMDHQRLAEAVLSALKAHPYINTHFETRDGTIMQARCDEQEPQVACLTMTDEEFARFKEGFVKPFDLSVWPLYRIAVVGVTGGKTYLLMDVHHLIFDGLSMGVFLRDVSKACTGESLVPSNYTFFDYALEEAAKTDTPAYREAEAYIDGLMKKYEAPTEIPTDLSGAEENGALAQCVRTVDRKETDDFCRKLGTTPAGLFLAAAFYTVSRFAGTRQVYLSAIDSGRDSVKLHSLLGMFVHTLPLAMDFEAGGTVRALIEKSQEALRQGARHEIYSFASFAAKYNYSTRIMFEYQVGVTGGGQIGGEAFTLVPMVGEKPKFPVSLTITEKESEYSVAVRCNDAMYLPDTIEMLAQSLVTCIRHMIRNADAPFNQLSLLSEEEEKLVTACGIGETASIPQILTSFGLDQTADIHQLVFHRVFEEQTRLQPDKTAVIACDRTMTYSELNNEANAVAKNLISRGIKRGDRLILLLPRRSFYMTVMLGVLKAGAAVVPCDPTYPPERIRLILEDSGAPYILTTAEHMSDYDGESVIDVRTLLTGADAENPEAGSRGDDMMYMLYTSGSTGRPKGAMIRHSGVVNNVCPHPVNVIYHVLKEQGTSMLTVTSVSHDMFFIEVGGALLNGKTVVFPNESELNNPRALAELFTKTGADCINATPSRLQQYMEYEPFRKAVHQCCLVSAGGEFFSKKLLNQLREALPQDAHIVNLYGPTETTMTSHMKDITNIGHIVVGPPQLNYTSYVVDADGNMLPRRVTGELLIGGAGVAMGYWNLPELTAQQFIDWHGSRFYRSGDNARLCMNGDVEIMGRVDNQVKLRGLRIELGEIETQIEQNAPCTRAVAAIRKVGGQDNLCAWFTAENTVSIQALREKLAKVLPAYMVPVAFTQLERIPFTPNGKVDTKALPNPQRIESAAYEEPQNEVERFFCDVFAGILKLERVGATDDFFSLGGSSLTATSVMIRAEEQGYKLEYGDVFKRKTPRALAALFGQSGQPGEASRGLSSQAAFAFDDYDYSKINELLSHNTLDAFHSGEKRPIGNILLTGATGFMGVHILAEYLRSEQGTAWCLVRKGKARSVSDRLKRMMFYYFGDSMEAMENRIVAVEGDITSFDAFEALKAEPIDTVFHCAANVRHFSSGTDIEDINVGGTKTVLRFCRETGARMIHASTTSVAGAMIAGTSTEMPKLNEQSLYFGQIVDNQYVSSKLMAERIVLEAAAEGQADAKVIRVGELSPRESDGEFQINFLSNSAMGRLRSYAMLGCFPYSMMNRAMRLGPIDATAKSFMALAKTPKACCLFHATNNHIIPTMDVVHQMQECGIHVQAVEDEQFQRRFQEAEQDPKKAAILASILAYRRMDHSIVPVETVCEYTSQILARMGFYWNSPDKVYIKQFIQALSGLDFFDEANLHR